MKRFDLMHGVNARGTFLCTQACLPHLARAANPHVLMLSPPLSMRARWFAPHVAYTMAKYGMSMCVLGMAEELQRAGIAVNALWPRTVIATAALQPPRRRRRRQARPDGGDRRGRGPRHPHPPGPRPAPATSSSTRTCSARREWRTSTATRCKRGEPLMRDLFVDEA